MAKKNEKQPITGPNTQGSEEVSPKNGRLGRIFYPILALVTALVVVASVVLGAFYLIIHYNFNGFTDKYEQNIRKMPILHYALQKQPDANAPENFTKEKLVELYKQYSEENTQLKQQLHEATVKNEELAKYQQESETLTTTVESLQNEMNIEKAKYEEYKSEVDALVARGDTEGFSEYFSQVNSEVAERIYTEIIEEEEAGEEAKEFAQLYEKMDTGSCAKIFENLGTSKLDLISYTLKNMKKDIAAEILSEMSDDFAAKLTDKLANDYGIVLPNT